MNNQERLMKRLWTRVWPAILCLASGVAIAGDSLLRITCEGADVGAEIQINGKFRGECPVDLKVKPGTLRIRLSKPIDHSRERAFEVELRIGEDSVKKIEAQLAAGYTAAGQLVEERRVRAEQELVLQQSRAAEAGDADAQVRLGERLRAGNGVPMDKAKSDYWLKRAAAAGNELAQFLTVDTDKSSLADDIEEVKRMLRMPPGERRKVDVRGHGNVIGLVDADPFFALPPAAAQFHALSLGSLAGPNASNTCQRRGNLTFSKFNNPKGASVETMEIRAALGGVIALETNSAEGVSKARYALTGIDSVYGSPFPLRAGKRFGLDYTDSDGTREDPVRLSCMVPETALALLEPALAGAPQLICLYRQPQSNAVRRMAYHEGSGCFFNARRRN